MPILAPTLALVRPAFTAIAAFAAVAVGSPPAHTAADAKHEHGPAPAPAAAATQGAKGDAKPGVKATASATAAADKHGQAAEKPVAVPAKKTTALPAPKNPAAPAGAEDAKPTVALSTDDAAVASAEEALERLKAGNARWVSGEPTNPHSDGLRRKDLADNGQHPFASILTCADSRVPAERVFDQGVGDLFVIRVAGNVAGTSESGTIEYGAEHLKTPLLVVMGHTKCGAVAAAATKAAVEGNVAALVAHIQPAVDRAAKANPELAAKDLVGPAVKENVWQSIFDLLRFSPPVRHMAASGQLKIVGAVYDISSGKVEWLGEHPWQSELVSAFDARDKRRATEAAAPGSTPAPAAIKQADAEPAHAPAH